MKFAQQLMVLAAACCLSLAGVHAAPAESVSAKNAIQAINVAPQGADILVKIEFKEPLTAPPAGFSISNPARVALDFPGTSNALGRSSQAYNQGDLSSIHVVQVGDRTRMVLNLLRSLKYDAKIDGNSLLVTLKSISAMAADGKAASKFSEESLIGRKHSVTDISFRRGKDGEARILVDMSDPGAGIDIRQQGASLIVDFLKTTVPENLKRRLDVTDFATPVTAVATTTQGENVRMVISPKGLWEHTAYQTDNQFVIEVKPVIENPNKLVQGSKLGYQGPRVSINYQNGDVRALLRLMAEELGLNAVISETVTGTTTLVLKDVPADQVVDIIFQQKGLDMRKNGNVILIAPREELALREKLDAEAKLQLGDIEPLRMEPIQLSYQKAVDVARLLTGTGAGSAGAAPRILSKRGSVTADVVTNQVFVNDTPSKLEEARNFIKLVDVGSKQVLIEARVVEANDNFNKDIGVRLGFSNTKPVDLIHQNNNTIQLGGTASSVNLPGLATGGNLSLSFFNKSMTRILNLELQALEKDGRGKLISSPKVMTANNVMAKIEDGKEVPYVTPASGNTAATVAFKKVVLLLEVTPQITPDGRVKMKLNINKDDLDWENAVQNNPGLKTTKIETDVVVDNGGSVVIGGVFSIKNTDNTERTPFLGDLPYIGFLFKQNSKVTEKRELLIFITPRILNDQLTLN